MEADICVVIPVYNREKTIGRCIESILKQEMPPKEINIVDDGSADSSVEIIKKYQIEHSNIHLFLQNHLGAQAARNAGIINAKSEWIAFLDSDDEWCPNFLSTINKCIQLEDNRSVVICTSCYKDDGTQRVVWNLFGYSGYVYPSLLTHPWPMLQGLVVKKNELEAIGLLDEACPAYQEWDTSLRLSKNVDFIFINKPLFIYSVKQDIPTISADSYNDYKGWRYVVEKHMEEILQVCGRRTLAKHYRHLSKRTSGMRKFIFSVKFFIQMILSIAITPPPPDCPKASK